MAQTGVNPHAAADLLRQAMAQKYVMATFLDLWTEGSRVTEVFTPVYDVAVPGCASSESGIGFAVTSHSIAVGGTEEHPRSHTRKEVLES